jgi:hypothetical protein
MVPHIMGGTQNEGVWEHGAEENIWTQKELNDKKLESNA